MRQKTRPRANELSRCTCGALLVLAAGLSTVARADAPIRIAWNRNFLRILSPGVPGGAVEILYLEAFCRTGSTHRDWRETVIPHKTTKLAEGPDGRTLRLKTTVEPGVEITHTITAGTDEVDFRLVLTNPTRQDVDIDWFQPCMRVGAFTGLGQKTYPKRCFIFTERGLTMLDKTRRTEKALYHGGQVYVPKGINRLDVNPRPLSPDVPINGLIGCVSADGKRLLATAWDHTQELFQGVIVCAHADPRIGGLRAGETKKLHGKIYLVPNDPNALLARYHRDFPAASPG